MTRSVLLSNFVDGIFLCLVVRHVILILSFLYVFLHAESDAYYMRFGRKASFVLIQGMSLKFETESKEWIIIKGKGEFLYKHLSPSGRVRRNKIYINNMKILKRE